MRHTFPLLVVLLCMLSACSNPAKDLAGHIEAATEIIDDNMDDPETAVDELREYMRTNLPSAMAALGEMFKTLHEADGRAERRELIEEWAEVLYEPVAAFEEVADEFDDELRDDRGARREMRKIEDDWEQFGERIEDYLEDEFDDRLRRRRRY